MDDLSSLDVCHVHGPSAPECSVDDVGRSTESQVPQLLTCSSCIPAPRTYTSSARSSLVEACGVHSTGQPVSAVMPETTSEPRPKGIPTSSGHGDLPAGLQIPSPLPFPPLSLFDDKHRTISHALTQDRSLTPKKASKRLFPKPNVFKRFYRRWYIKWDLTHVRHMPRSTHSDGPHTNRGGKEAQAGRCFEATLATTAVDSPRYRQHKTDSPPRNNRAECGLQTNWIRRTSEVVSLVDRQTCS